MLLMQSVSREADAATIVLSGDLGILKDEKESLGLLDHLAEGKADVVSTETKRV